MFAHMRSLHTSLNITHSGCKPNTSTMSSSTHSFQVFLFLPLHLTPATSTYLEADTQSSTLLRSRCPNHLNLPCLTTSATLCTMYIAQINSAALLNEPIQLNDETGECTTHKNRNVSVAVCSLTCYIHRIYSKNCILSS